MWDLNGRVGDCQRCDSGGGESTVFRVAALETERTGVPRGGEQARALLNARHIRFEIKRARLNAQALRPEFTRCNVDPGYGNANVRLHDKPLNRNALGAICKHSEKYEHSVHS